MTARRDKKLYLLACFCSVWWFCCQRSVTEFWKWIAILHRLDSWILKKEAIFFTLLRNKPNINDCTFSCHIFPNVLGVEMCVFWGVQCSAFSDDFSSNHSLLLIYSDASLHLLWPALQLMIVCFWHITPGLFHLCVWDVQRGFLKKYQVTLWSTWNMIKVSPPNLLISPLPVPKVQT